MSTFRRVFLSVVLAIVLALAGVLAIGLNTVHGSIAQTLQLQGKLGATRLAAALSNPAISMSGWNEIQGRALISNEFAQGHYSLIRLTTSRGSVFEERRPETPVNPVFARFRQAVGLSGALPAASAVVKDSSGPIGELLVRADADQAWNRLRQTAIYNLAVFMAMGLLCLLASMRLVRWRENWLVRQLADRVHSLGGISPLETSAPKIDKLTEMVLAIDQANERIKATLIAQSKRIDSLTVELHQDPVTHIANRKYFINALRKELEGDYSGLPTGKDGQGYIVAFRQRDLGALNQHMPRELTDQWLRSLAERIGSVMRVLNPASTVIARLNGSDFAILIPGVNVEQTRFIAERVRLELRAARIQVGDGALCRWAMTFAEYRPGRRVSNVLALLDHALMRSESEGDDTIAQIAGAEPIRIGTGEYAWKDEILTGLNQHRFSLTTRDLSTLDGILIRQEAMLVLHSDSASDPVPAKFFIPAAIRLGLSADCDIQAIRLGLDWLVSNAGELTVKVSLPSLNDDQFMPRLHRMLTDRLELAARLVLEIDAHGLVENYPAVRALCDTAALAGAKMGIRRLAQQFGALTQLHRLTLAYLKLSGAFVNELADSPGGRQLVRSVVETAKTLRVQVYAEDVSDRQAQRILIEAGIIVVRTFAIHTLPTPS